MNKEFIIDAAAIIGKEAIEQTELPEVAKVSINWTIDRVAEYLNGTLNLDRIRSTAQKFDVDKVVAIPYHTWRGEEVVFRVYGRQSEPYLKHLGMVILPKNCQDSFLKAIHEKEKQFGIVLYEKK